MSANPFFSTMSSSSKSNITRHTCLKLNIPPSNNESSIFMKGMWHNFQFTLSITDGINAWICDASEEEVRSRAEQWDLGVEKYIELMEKFLGFQQVGSVYGFHDASNGCKWLSWTFVNEGTKFEWLWKCQPSPDSKKTTSEVLDFLMDAHVRLSGRAVERDDFRRRLEDQIIPLALEWKFSDEFFQLKQSEKMSVKEYAIRFEELSVYGEELIDTPLKKNKKFVYGLLPSLQVDLIGSKFETFDDLLIYALRLESVHAVRDEGRKLQHQRGGQFQPYARKKKCFCCGKVGHVWRDCPKGKAATTIAIEN